MVGLAVSQMRVGHNFDHPFQSRPGSLMGGAPDMMGMRLGDLAVSPNHAPVLTRTNPYKLRQGLCSHNDFSPPTMGTLRRQGFALSLGGRFARCAQSLCKNVPNLHSSV